MISPRLDLLPFTGCSSYSGYLLTIGDLYRLSIHPAPKSISDFYSGSKNAKPPIRGLCCGRGEEGGGFRKLLPVLYQLL